MKKILLTLALASAFAVVSAQKPAVGSMGFTGGIQGFFAAGGSPTGTLMFKYALQQDMAVRAAINFGTLAGNGTTVSDSTPALGGDGVTHTTTVKSGMAWSLSVGAQKSMPGTKNLEPYMGADVWFGSTSNGNTDMKQEWLIDGKGTVAGVGAVPGKKGDFIQSVTTATSTMRYGVRAVVGMNYFFSENLAIGAEFGYGYMNASTSGGEVKTSSSATINGVAAPAGFAKTVTASSDAKASMGNMGTTGGMLTLSWFFK